jgi:hypothetical protein
MKNLVYLCLFCLTIASLPPAAMAADGPAAFQVVYRQDSPVVGEVTTTSNLLLTVVNHTGAEAKDVVVSAANVNPYYLINLPVPFGNIPDGAHAEVLVPAEVPNLFAADGHAQEVVWQIQYASGTGEVTTVEIVGEKVL